MSNLLMNPSDDNPSGEPGVRPDLNEGSPEESEIRKDEWQVAIVEGDTCNVADRLARAIDIILAAAARPAH